MTITDRREAVAEGLAVKAPCRVATTANITLAGLQTIDGVALAEGDRVLVKNQSAGVDNGIYTASSGNWQRTRDFDGAYDAVTGTRVYVTSGTLSGDTEFVVTTSGTITIGTTSITFTSIQATAMDTAVASAAAASASASSATSSASSASSSASSATSSASAASSSASAAAASAASATPVAGSFKNLSIKVTTNTACAVAADFVCMTNGTTYLTKPCSGTINFAAAGASGLDTGSLASGSKDYHIWSIAKADGTTAPMASLKSTADATFLSNLPSGYTYYARIGCVKSAAGSANLMGTWQYGRRTQYVVGLASTSSILSMLTGASGNVTTPTWTTQSVIAFVPSTASVIEIVLNGTYASGIGANIIIAAPNSSYGGCQSTTNPPPLGLINGGGGGSSGALGGSLKGSLVLESTNIYLAIAAASTCTVYCVGWEDNI